MAENANLQPAREIVIKENNCMGSSVDAALWGQGTSHSFMSFRKNMRIQK